MWRTATASMVAMCLVSTPVVGQNSIRLEKVYGIDSSDLLRIRDAELQPDGSVLVVNSGTREVLWFDESGLRRRIGGQGEGPGEFLRPVSATADGGTVRVVDLSLGRITQFASAGGQPDTESIPGSDWVGASFAHELSEIGLVVLRDEHAATSGHVQSTARLLVIGADDEEPIHRLAELSGRDLYYLQVGNRVYALDVPFANTALAAVGRDGSIAYSNSNATTVSIRRPEGVVEQLELGVEPIDVSPTMLDRELSRVIESIRDRGLTPGSIERQLPIPERAPTIESLAVDDSGVAWVTLTEHINRGATEVRILHSGGRTQTLRLPASEQVLDIAHGHLVTRRVDDFEVGSLVVYRIVSG